MAVLADFFELLSAYRNHEVSVFIACNRKDDAAGRAFWLSPVEEWDPIDAIERLHDGSALLLFDPAAFQHTVFDTIDTTVTLPGVVVSCVDDHDVTGHALKKVL